MTEQNQNAPMEQINTVLELREKLLATLIEKERKARKAALHVIPKLSEGLQRPAVLPLSYAQERLWTLEQMETVGSAYHVPASVRLRGALDVGALERAFATVVERHEGLRARFTVVDGSPVQVIDPAGLFGLQ